MIECSVNNIAKYYGATKIFENISFELKSNERVGLIGLNGSGKTTLMKVLMGIEEYQEGEIHFRKDIKLGYLDQIFNLEDKITVIEVLESAFENIKEIRNKMRILEKEMGEETDKKLENTMERYSQLLEEYEKKGGYDIEMEINRVCEGLNIKENFRNRKFNGLSGGEQTRIMLGKLLLEKPDLLLMDEPTNHLDIESIEWLEEFMQNYMGTVLIISHDRVFLDRVVNKIIELDPKKASIYLGNYSYYVEEKERRYIEEYNAYKNQQRKIKEMEDQIERYRIWGKMRDSDKMYVRAKEIEKRLEKIDELDRPDIETKKMRLNQEGVERSGKRVLDIENLSKSYGEKILFKDINFSIFYQERICIMGANGSGKSTLLKIILGEEKEDSGIIKLGASLKIGYLPQMVEFEDESKNILEHFMDLHKLTNGEARTELAKVLFLQDDVYKKIRTLSGGEKSRLKLASLLYNKVNFMILDEPTNHLDIDSREVLEYTLLNYTGTILFVSHDRYFVEKIADKMMILKNKKLKIYEMDYNSYIEIKKREIENKEIKIKEKKPKKINKKPEKKKDRSDKIKRLEIKIEELENNLKEIDKLMEENSSNPNELNNLYIEKENLEIELENIFTEWAEISEE